MRRALLLLALVLFTCAAVRSAKAQQVQPLFRDAVRLSHGAAPSAPRVPVRRFCTASLPRNFKIAGVVTAVGGAPVAAVAYAVRDDRWRGVRGAFYGAGITAAILAVSLSATCDDTAPIGMGLWPPLAAIVGAAVWPRRL